MRAMRKCQANVLSGLILAASVIATWTLILSWAHASLESLHRSVFEEVTTGIEALKENIVIEDFIYQAGNDYALIAIRNVGMNNVKISKVYVNDTEVTVLNIIIDGVEYSSDITINEGAYAYIKISFSATQVKYVRLKIMSEREVNYYAGFKVS